MRATTWGSAGSLGANYLTSSLGLVITGQVLPADAFTADDQGVATSVAPPALFDTPASFGFGWR